MGGSSGPGPPGPAGVLLLGAEDGPDLLEDLPGPRLDLGALADHRLALLAEALLRGLGAGRQDVAHRLCDRGVLLQEHAERVAVQAEQLAVLHRRAGRAPRV